jgi:phosphoribosylaminoimidazole (AIR) synthetase
MVDRKNGLTYADSGVDIDAGNRLVDLIKPMVRATARRLSSGSLTSMHLVSRPLTARPAAWSREVRPFTSR